jgi:hypothetical protein
MGCCARCGGRWWEQRRKEVHNGGVIVLLVMVMNGDADFPTPSVYGPFGDLLECQQLASELQASEAAAGGALKRYACILSQPIGSANPSATEE